MRKFLLICLLVISGLASIILLFDLLVRFNILSDSTSPKWLKEIVDFK